MKRVTIKDVAHRAGVSFAAVSRAFQAEGRISPATRQKVFEAAQALGYRPSPIARGLVRARSGLVTLLTGPTQSVFDVQFFDALSVGLAQAGRHLMVVNVSAEAEVEAGLLQALDYKSEAAIVSAGTMSLELSSRCASAGLPVVLAGRALEVPGVTSVLAENVEGGRQAGALLARVASGPLCFFGNGGRTFAERERAAGFAEAVAAAGCAVPSALAVAERETPQDAAMAMLSGPNPPRGVFCANDGLAFALLQAAMLLGLRVPEDLAVIGFDNVPMAAWPVFGLTTIDYPVPALVEAILAAVLAEPDRRPMPITRIPTRLVVRRTTPTHFPAPYRTAP